MKKIIIIIILILSFYYSKAPHTTKLYKDIRSHYYWLESQELKRKQEFQKFLVHLAMRESSNNWKIINDFGYVGLYQFGNDALKTIGMGNITVEKFKINPYIFPIGLQNEAIKKLIIWNLSYLKRYNKYIGCTINDVYITKSGLIAASHLGGVGGAIKFLKSNINLSDKYGTSISDYLIEFANYNF